LIGTKFDLFVELEASEKDNITKQARKFAKKMHAPLIYCSSKNSINIKKIFKVIIAKVFDLQANLKELHDEEHEALLEFNISDDKNDGNKKKPKKKPKANHDNKDKENKDVNSDPKNNGSKNDKKKSANDKNDNKKSKNKKQEESDSDSDGGNGNGDDDDDDNKED